MSRTHRTLKKVKFCNQCNRPIWQHTVEVYELCDCPNEFVEMEVRNWYWSTEENDIVYDGWKTTKMILPKSTYYRYNMKGYDGKGEWYTQNNAGVRKDAQQYFNSKMRSETNKTLKNRTKDFDEMSFPVKRNQVDWEIW